MALSRKISRAVSTPVVAALLGGLVAGGASVATTVVTQNSENDRVERRVDEEARGAARVLVSRFATTLNYSAATLDAGRFATYEPAYVATISADDLELVTARLSVDEYRAVDVALRDTTSFFVMLREAVAGQTLAEGNREDLRAFRADIAEGIKALRSVADLPS